MLTLKQLYKGKYPDCKNIYSNSWPVYLKVVIKVILTFNLQTSQSLRDAVVSINEKKAQYTH